MTDNAARTDLRLRWVAIAASAVGITALVLHVFGWLRMPFVLTVAGLPSILVLFALAAYARRVDARLFLNGLWVGLWGGTLATIVYDGVRAIVERSAIFGYNWYVPILLFGSWITGLPKEDPVAVTAGWAYHYWNGATFGIMYALALGPVRWWWGVAYGIFLEACMLGLFPMFLRVTNKFDFVAISMIGHIFYGAVLGWAVQRYTLPSQRVPLWSRKG